MDIDRKTIRLKDARLCVYWSADLRGFMGLAAYGPSGSCRTGSPANGGKGEPAFIGKREKKAGPLKICTPQALHGTVNPARWKGDRLWLVLLHGEVVWDGDKFAALEREIIAEVKQDHYERS